MQKTPPPEEDGMIKYMKLSTKFYHSGGIQTLGDVLAISMESSDDSRVVFYNMANPESPRRLGPILDRPGWKAAAVGITKLDDGRFMLMVAGPTSGYDGIMDFYVSTTTDISNTEYIHYYRWQESVDGVHKGPNVDDAHWPKRSPVDSSYQNYNFINECAKVNEDGGDVEGGKIYMVATHSVDNQFQDWAALYLLENGVNDDGDESVVVTKVADKHMYCMYRSKNNCKFAASGNIYIDNNRRLTIYASEHQSKGPGGSVRFMQFRNKTASPGCQTLEDSWAEVFEDKDYTGRSLMIDYQYRDKENYSDYHIAEYFNDEVSSAQWCIPKGCSLRLYKDKNFGGEYKDLDGTGDPEKIENFKDIDFNDRVSSSEWRDADGGECKEE